jgi:hypothetical protein
VFYFSVRDIHLTILALRIPAFGALLTNDPLCEIWGCHGGEDGGLLVSTCGSARRR